MLNVYSSKMTDSEINKGDERRMIAEGELSEETMKNWAEQKTQQIKNGETQKMGLFS